MSAPTTAWEAERDGWSDEDFFGSAEQDSERELICVEEVQPEIRRRYRELALGAVGLTADYTNRTRAVAPAGSTTEAA